MPNQDNGGAPVNVELRPPEARSMTAQDAVRDRNSGVAGREAAVAITQIQTASMWSVLAATKGTK